VGVKDDSAAPADFVGFVETYGRRLMSSCLEITGHDHLAESLRLDLFAVVAQRWRRWWRPAGRRSRAGLRLLNRLLRREVRTYHLVPDRAAPPPLTDASAARPGLPARAGLPAGAGLPARAGLPALPAGDAGPDEELREVAAEAWRRSRRLRGEAAIQVAIAVLVLGLIVVLAPGPRLGPPPSPVIPEPLPLGVTMLPTFDELSGLTRVSSVLPLALTDDGGELPALAPDSLNSAVAVVQPSASRLIVVSNDGARAMDRSEFRGANLLATSLSPDGSRIVLTAAAGLLVVDVASASVRLVPAASGPVSILTWRSPDIVLVPGPGAAIEVDLVSGRTTPVSGLTGADVVSYEGDDKPALAELLARASVTSQRPGIRIWRADPSTVDGQPESGRDVEERQVIGPQWISTWSGPAWASNALYARTCVPAAVRLPERFGLVRAAVVAVKPNGLHAGTLVSTDPIQLDVLGFLRPEEVLVAVRAPAHSMLLVSWVPGDGALALVSTAPMSAPISVADLVSS
jgi:hypothetical protein